MALTEQPLLYLDNIVLIILMQTITALIPLVIHITQGDKTSSADVTVTIEAVNDAPSIDTASTIQVAENQTAVQQSQSQM